MDYVRNAPGAVAEAAPMTQQRSVVSRSVNYSGSKPDLTALRQTGDQSAVAGIGDPFNPLVFGLVHKDRA